MSRILAIDPGSALGWATDATGRLEFGEEDFHVKSGESSGNRWRRFGEWLNSVTLVQSEFAIAYNVVQPNVPGIDLIVYERSIFAPKARAAAEIAAGFTTRLEEHCELHGIALQPVAPATIKKFATGKGNADKGAMVTMAYARLGPSGLPGSLKLTHNVADALWLYWWAKAYQGG